MPPRLYCLVDPLAGRALVPSLRGHFESEPRVAVLVERRRGGGAAGRPGASSEPAHRRAPVAERDPARALPPELRHAARHLRLVQPMAPLGRSHEDLEFDALVARAVAMEPEATSELWWRVAPRALGRLARHAGGADAPGAAAALLGHILDELPGHDPAREPLATWLDTTVDRYAAERLVA